MIDRPATGTVVNGSRQYLREFGTHWRPLAASFVGMGSGYTINNYTNNVFIPPLMNAFGWKSANIALLSATAILSVVFQPIAGRLTDRFGVRPVALFGALAATAIFMLFSVMNGSFWVFLVLVTAQIMLVASTTGAVVFSRPIAQSFSRARGLALSAAVCAPSLVGALAVPSLSRFIAEHGWRAGYQLCAAATLVFGLVAVRLTPAGRGEASAGNGLETPDDDADRSPIAATVRRRTMLLILAGMVLCSLSIALQTTQLKVVVLGLGLDGARASTLISVYAIGVILGRVLSGISLDLLPTRMVACVAMALPGVGLLILASGTVSPPLLLAAMLTLGLSLGAEGDIAGFLVMTYYPKRVYSRTLGLVIGAIAFAAGAGGLLLSAILAAYGTFAPFLVVAGIGAFIGGALFLGLGANSKSSVAAVSP